MHGPINVKSVHPHLLALANTQLPFTYTVLIQQNFSVRVQTETEKWLRRGCVEILWSVPLFNFYTMPDDGLTMKGNHEPVYLLLTRSCVSWKNIGYLFV